MRGSGVLCEQDTGESSTRYVEENGHSSLKGLRTEQRRRYWRKLRGPPWKEWQGQKKGDDGDRYRQVGEDAEQCSPQNRFSMYV